MADRSIDYFPHRRGTNGLTRVLYVMNFAIVVFTIAVIALTRKVNRLERRLLSLERQQFNQTN